MLLFDGEISPIGLCVRPFGPQQVALFWKAVEPLEAEALLEEIGNWEQGLEVV